LRKVVPKMGQGVEKCPRRAQPVRGIARSRLMGFALVLLT
jgi:hypothetical protein